MTNIEFFKQQKTHFVHIIQIVLKNPRQVLCINNKTVDYQQDRNVCLQGHGRSVTRTKVLRNILEISVIPSGNLKNILVKDGIEIFHKRHTWLLS